MFEYISNQNAVYVLIVSQDKTKILSYIRFKYLNENDKLEIYSYLQYIYIYK